MQVSVKLNIGDTSTRTISILFTAATWNSPKKRVQVSTLNESVDHRSTDSALWMFPRPTVAVQSPTALRLIYVSSPLLSPFSFFGRDSLNEVFVLHPELQTPSKWSSIKLLPSSAPRRDLRRANFHWISGMLRLNGLVFKARASSEGRRRLEGLRARRRMEGRTRTERQRRDEPTGILVWLANWDSCTVSTHQKEISHAVPLVMEGKEI